jgi:hypothetical protein
VNAAVVLLAERPKLTAAITINGTPVAVEAPHLQVEDSKDPARTYDGKVFGQRDKGGLTIKGPWSLFRAPLASGKSAVQVTLSCNDLDLIRLTPPLKPVTFPSPRTADVPFRCMIQTQQDLAPPPAAKDPSELPDRWANVLRRTVDVAPPANIKLESARRFEIYEVKPGTRLFMDADGTITDLPPALVGRKGIRFPKSQAAQNAALALSLSRPMRAVAAFGKPGGASGYLAPPPDWTLCKNSAIQTTDPSLGPDLYVLDLPKGDLMLFPAMSGAYAILALAEQPENLALKRPVSVQSSLAGHDVPAAVTDGDIKTQWWSANGLPQWCQVDLGKERNVNSVRIIFYHEDGRHYQYKVETSLDGNTWQPAYDATKNLAPSTATGYRHAFSSRPARYVRVTVTGGGRGVSASHICELEVFDDKLATLEQ